MGVCADTSAKGLRKSKAGPKLVEGKGRSERLSTQFGLQKQKELWEGTSEGESDIHHLGYATGFKEGTEGMNLERGGAR